MVPLAHKRNSSCIKITDLIRTLPQDLRRLRKSLHLRVALVSPVHDTTFWVVIVTSHEFADIGCSAQFRCWSITGVAWVVWHYEAGAFCWKDRCACWLGWTAYCNPARKEGCLNIHTQLAIGHVTLRYSCCSLSTCCRLNRWFDMGFGSSASDVGKLACVDLVLAYLVFA